MFSEKRALALTAVLVSLVGTCPNAAGSAPEGQAHGSRHQEVLPSLADFRTRAALITIFPCTSSIVLEAGSFETETPYRGPGGGQAKCSITAQSPLPRWGVCVELSTLEGPAGTLPPDRIWVRSEATENVYQPLDHPVQILTADARVPYRQVFFEIQVRPTWLDKPGQYRGHIVARPVLPRGKGEQLSAASWDERLGLAQEILIECEIPEAILTSFSETEIEFKADAGPGEYPADREVRFTLTTNAQQWRVDYRASSLAGDEDDIRIDRMSWERVDELGRIEASGNVGADETVVSGIGPIEGLEVRLRFKIQITMEDQAGEYGGVISLVGLTSY